MLGKIQAEYYFQPKHVYFIYCNIEKVVLRVPGIWGIKFLLIVWEMNKVCSKLTVCLVVSSEGLSETHQLFNQTTYILQTIQLINVFLTVCVRARVWFLYKQYEYIISNKSR